jgi:hypothetical protein
MTWISWCFVAYMFLGLFSTLCSVAGVAILCAARCDSPASEDGNADRTDVERGASLSVSAKRSFAALLILSVFWSLLLLALGCVDVATAMSKTPPRGEFLILDDIIIIFWMH